MYTCKYCGIEKESEEEIIEYRVYDYFQTCLECENKYDFVNNLHYSSKVSKLNDAIYAVTHADEIETEHEDYEVENQRAYYRSLSPIDGVPLETMTKRDQERVQQILELRLRVLQNKRDIYKEKLRKTKSFVCDNCNHRYRGLPNEIKGQEYTRVLCSQCKREHDAYYDNMHELNKSELSEEELRRQSFLNKINILETEIEILEDYTSFKDIDPKLELHYFGNIKISNLNPGLAYLALLSRKEELKKITKEFYNIDSGKELAINQYNASQRKEKIITQASSDVSISNIRFDPVEFKAELDQMVIGQEDAKIQLIIECLKFYSGNKNKNNLLLVGPSGSGKTHLVNSLVKLLSDYYSTEDYYNTAEVGRPDSVPYLEVDIQQFTAAGYKGREVSEMFQPLINQYHGDMEKMAGAIIFIDEIDKIAGYRLSNDQESHLKAVQQNLLKVVEGDKIPFTYDGSPGIVDTRKFLFIGAGAFEGLSEIRENRLSGDKKKIGFGKNSNDEKESADQNYTTEDLIEYGLIPELLGRLPIVSELNGLNTDEWILFLKDNELSPVNEAKQICENYGIPFLFKEKYYSLFAEKCKNNSLGVRGVRKEFMQLFNQQLYDSIKNNSVLEFNYSE